MADQLRSLADQVSDDKLKDGLKSAATSLGRIAVEYRNNANELTNIATSLTNSMAEVNKSRAEVDQAITDARMVSRAPRLTTILRSRLRPKSSRRPFRAFWIP